MVPMNPQGGPNGSRPHGLDSVSLWDASVIRTAEHAGRDTIFSECLQPFRRFGPVRVGSPIA